MLVSVVDSASARPVSGATVSADFNHGSWLSGAFRHKSQIVTGDSGKVLLKVFCPRPSGRHTEFPSWLYKVTIKNDRYDDCVAVSDPDMDRTLFDRSGDFIPTETDIVLEVTNRRIQARGRAEAEAKRKADERRVDALIQRSPDFWPPHKDDSDPWIKDDIGQLLLDKRWTSASKKPLGTKAEIDAISAAVIQHMGNPKARVEEVRWLSPSLVMVSSGWYASPQAAAGYLYILRKDNNRWTVLAYYLLSVA
jgi:hypothetical protein